MELKGHDLSHASDLQSLNDTDEDQFLPHERRDITYVTRLKVQVQSLCIVPVIKV